MDIKDYLVTNSADGTVNVGASVEKFRAALLDIIALRESEEKEIGKVVNEVFDQHQNANINLPALCSFVLSKLPNINPLNWEENKVKVAEYVHNHPERFNVRKGKGGGVTRIQQAQQPQG